MRVGGAGISPTWYSRGGGTTMGWLHARRMEEGGAILRRTSEFLHVMIRDDDFPWFLLIFLIIYNKPVFPPYMDRVTSNTELFRY